MGQKDIEWEKERDAEVQRYKSLEHNVSDEGQKHLLQPLEHKLKEPDETEARLDI